MKNLRTLALTVAASFSFFASALANVPSGNEGRPAQGLTAFAHRSFISADRPDRLCLIVEKAEDAPVQVRVLNAAGEELYATSIRENAALKPIRLTYLEPGTYTLEMTRGSQVETDSFTVK